MPYQKTLVHILEDAVHPAPGGIDLSGLLTSHEYLNAVGRSILIGPMCYGFAEELGRLGPDFRILYSSQNGISHHSVADALADVEGKFGVAIIYGYRRFFHPTTHQPINIEIALIDVRRANLYPVNGLKAWMYDEFHLSSDWYENNPYYDTYVKLAPAALAVLRALGASNPSRPAILVSHNIIGVPTALAAIMDPLGAFKTIFCAYEVPTVRRVIESCSGHDTLFYNALKWARQNHYYLGELFGPQEHHFQYALTTSARFCDNIITVSERVKQELRFLEPQFDAVNIDPIYQGLSDGGLTPEQKLQSHTRLQQYIGNLLGFSPDYIFTHPTHLSTSQAHWRDLRILSHLAPQLDQVGRTAVYLVYSHGADAIRPAAISVDSRASKAATSARRVAHRDRHWALTHAEAELYCHLQDFNAHTQNIKAILVNALGWEAHQQDCCMPPDMTLSDLHQGTDLVFCQSIYEPFGPLLESAALGSLCVLSSVCGCNDLFDELMTTPPDHIIRADYTRINPQQLYRDAIFAMDQSHRDLIENQVAEQIARSILEQLPQNRGDMEKLIHQGRHLAQQVNWDNICRTFFLPAIDRAYHRRRDRQIA